MILMIIPPQMRNTYDEKQLEATAEVTFQTSVRSIHESMNGNLFNEICDSEGLLVITDKNGNIDETSQLLIKAFSQLRKPYYIYKPNESIIKVEAVNA